jgi:hypothetical protein
MKMNEMQTEPMEQRQQQRCRAAHADGVRMAVPPSPPLSPSPIAAAAR